MRGWISLILVALTACSSAPKAPESRELKLGKHHFKVTTASKEAQRRFDRGLTLAYSFAHYAAEQEFRRAIAEDPGLAMAWWGIALVNGPHINFPIVPPPKAKTAWEALTKALELSSSASELEKDLISALSKRYAEKQPDDRGPLDRAYAEAMRAVWQKHPTNADVGALFAESMMDLRPWDLWQPDGTPQPGTAEIVETLERALWLNKRHPGAMHFYIHTMEASRAPEKAEKAADRLRAAVPDAGHMVHMPAHIYARVGRWKDAAQSNLDAMAVDKLYRAAHPRPGFYAMYMAHNSHFFGWAAMMEGRSAEALQHARKMIDDVPEEFMKEFGGVVDGYLAFPVEVLMRFGKWEEILKEPAPPGGLPMSQAMWRYTRTSAFTALNRAEEASKEKKLFEAALAKVPHEATFGNNSATNLLTIAAHCIDGEIAAKAGNWNEAEKQLRAAIALEDALRYDEPPDWIQSVRHTLGAVLLKADRAPAAETVYREDLKKYPNNGWALFGLKEALKAQNKDASTVEAQFKKAWARADMSLKATCLCLQ